MEVFWPAVLLGSAFVVLGFLILRYEHRAQDLLRKRYSKAQERHPEVRFPSKSFLPLLGWLIVVFGIVAIGLGLTTPLRVG